MPGDDERPSVPRIVIEPFDHGRHDRSGFACGTDRLDNFLRLSARKQQKDDFIRVFVAVTEGSSEVLGYYALNAHAVATEDFGEDRLKRAPRTGSIPALYLSMIAADGRRQGIGLGSDLAMDALARAECRQRSRPQAGRAGCHRRRRRGSSRAPNGVLSAAWIPEPGGSAGTNVHHGRHDSGHVRREMNRADPARRGPDGHTERRRGAANGGSERRSATSSGCADNERFNDVPYGACLDDARNLGEGCRAGGRNSAMNWPELIAAVDRKAAQTMAQLEGARVFELLLSRGECRAAAVAEAIRP